MVLKDAQTPASPLPAFRQGYLAWLTVFLAAGFFAALRLGGVAPALVLLASGAAVGETGSSLCGCLVCCS